MHAYRKQVKMIYGFELILVLILSIFKFFNCSRTKIPILFLEFSIYTINFQLESITINPDIDEYNEASSFFSLSVYLLSSSICLYLAHAKIDLANVLIARNGGIPVWLCGMCKWMFLAVTSSFFAQKFRAFLLNPNRTRAHVKANKIKYLYRFSTILVK